MAVRLSLHEPELISQSTIVSVTTQTEAVVTEIQALGRHAVLVEGSVFHRPSCEDVVSRAITALGCINIFVSNPAFQRRADFLTFDPDIFTQVIEGTLTGGFHMSQLVARHMVERGNGGKIIFISSCHVHIPYTPECSLQRW